MLGNNSYMFRHHDAIFRKWNRTEYRKSNTYFRCQWPPLSSLQLQDLKRCSSTVYMLKSPSPYCCDKNNIEQCASSDTSSQLFVLSGLCIQTSVTMYGPQGCRPAEAHNVWGTGGRLGRGGLQFTLHNSEYWSNNTTNGLSPCVSSSVYFMWNYSGTHCLTGLTK